MIAASKVLTLNSDRFRAKYESAIEEYLISIYSLFSIQVENIEYVENVVGLVVLDKFKTSLNIDIEVDCNAFQNIRQFSWHFLVYSLSVKYYDTESS